MRTSVCLTLVLLISLAGFAVANVNSEYTEDLSAYFEVSLDTINQLYAEGVSQKDIATILCVSTRTNTEPNHLAEIRSQGHSWQTISNVRGMTPADFYIIIAAKFDSPTYSPIFGKFKSLPESQWNQLSFNDNEIRNLVNLRFVSSHHDYSVFEAMRLRDEGLDFAQLNSQIGTSKQALLDAAKDNPKLLYSGMGGGF